MFIGLKVLEDAHGVPLREAMKMVGDEVWDRIFGKIQHRIGVDLAGELSHEIGKAHEDLHVSPALFEVDEDEVDVMTTEVLDQIRARGIVVPELGEKL